jgi:hypothetical protein
MRLTQETGDTGGRQGGLHMTSVPTQTSKTFERTKIPVNNALGVNLMIRSALLGAMATRIPMLIPADARFPKPQTALHE